MKEAEGPQQNNVGDQAEQSLNELGDKAASQAADLAQQVEEQRHRLRAQTEAAATTLTGQGQQKLSDLTQQTSDKLDSAAHKASSLLDSAAGSLRSHAPEEGKTGEFAQQFAQGLEQSSSFLEKQSRKGVVSQGAELALRVFFVASLAAALVVFLAWLGRREQR
ncbi:MAG TPA: hypothetical protein PKE45_01595 [Caldilineaceae bacterium]|nr:hypothetical protein [Caldilineaceae bacterium]